MPNKANKGEWSEPYAALRILGDRRLYLAGENGEKDLNEWMEVLKLIRHETDERIVKYQYDVDKTDVEISVNDSLQITIPVSEMTRMADLLLSEIQNGQGRAFEISDAIQLFFEKAQIHHIKAKNIDKSDLFLSISDPRSSIVRNHIGFSIKSEFGHPPTLFNTAKASAVIFKLTGMTDDLMNEINSMVDEKGHAAVSKRCESLIANGCRLEFVGFPYVERAQCCAFAENLDLIDPRLGPSLARALESHFFEHDSGNDVKDIVEKIIEKNPCNLTRPEIKYPYMFKSFIYAAYCGMTASSLWDGSSQVNGGFIRVKSNGEVLAFYALESDAFKSYLYNNCFFEYPATSENHGNYAKVYKENDEFFFRLNFQIRYRVAD